MEGRALLGIHGEALDIGNDSQFPGDVQGRSRLVLSIHLIRGIAVDEVGDCLVEGILHLGQPLAVAKASAVGQGDIGRLLLQRGLCPDDDARVEEQVGQDIITGFRHPSLREEQCLDGRQGILDHLNQGAGLHPALHVGQALVRQAPGHELTQGSGLPDRLRPGHIVLPLSDRGDGIPIGNASPGIDIQIYAQELVHQFVQATNRIHDLRVRLDPRMYCDKCLEGAGMDQLMDQRLPARRDEVDRLAPEVGQPWVMLSDR